MIAAFAVIAIVVIGGFVFARGMTSDTQAFRDGTQRSYTTSDGNYDDGGRDGD